MLKPLTEKQITLIVNNLVKACKDIQQLNKVGYNFIYLASGFIAHYNRFGFIGYYTEYDLKTDILRNAKNNQWNNFRVGDSDYEYYMSKKEVYNRLVERLK